MAYERPLKNAYIGEYNGETYTPNSHTLLYLPFRSDMEDHSGNERTITYDIGGIVDGYFYNDVDNTSKTGIDIADMPALDQFTTSLWVKKTANAGGNVAMFLYSNGNQVHSIDFGTKIRFGVWGWDNDPSVPNNAGNVWRLLTYVREGSNFKLYINGSLNSSSSHSLNQPIGNRRFFAWGSTYHPLVGYASELIMEDTYWTAQQVADYYNERCTEYGLQPIN